MVLADCWGSSCALFVLLPLLLAGPTLTAEVRGGAGVSTISNPSSAFLAFDSKAFALMRRRTLVTFPSMAPKGYLDSKTGSRSCLHAIA